MRNSGCCILVDSVGVEPVVILSKSQNLLLKALQECVGQVQFGYFAYDLKQCSLDDPNRVPVYIDTTPSLFSTIGSMASLLKTVIVCSFERHTYTCGFITYISRLFTFSSLEDISEGTAQEHPVRRVDS